MTGMGYPAQIRCHLDRLLRQRGMTGAELSLRIGLSENAVSKLRRGDFSFIWLATLDALCRELDCQPGDLLTRG